MYWEALLQEVLNSKKQQKALSCENGIKKQNKASVQQKPPKKFFLGLENKDVYFTNREAEVMMQLLQGKTLSAAAAVLNLSPRTIEFYVKNMKAKVSCRTKSELIGKIFASEFMKIVDFAEGLITE